jgi:hypothetical protein
MTEARRATRQLRIATDPITQKNGKTTPNRIVATRRSLVELIFTG